MAKRQKAKKYSSEQIIAYCEETYGADHRITKATIAAHKNGLHKKVHKPVAANQTHKVKIATQAKPVKQSTKKRANNVVQFVAKRVSPFKQKLVPANINIVNQHRVVLGQAKFTKNEHKNWLMRFQAAENAMQIAA